MAERVYFSEAGAIGNWDAVPMAPVYRRPGCTFLAAAAKPVTTEAELLAAAGLLNEPASGVA